MVHMQMYDVDGWRMHRCIHNIDSELLQYRQQHTHTQCRQLLTQAQ